MRRGPTAFDFIRDAARERWNSELGRIRVEGGTDDQVRTFYSTLYRTMLFPRMFHETDSAGNIVHYSPYNGKVLPGRLYTDNGFWDTFRAAMPLITLMYPEMSSHIMEGLANAYLESGWLPEWASPGHRNCMIGSNSASLIADAYLKGIRGYAYRHPLECHGEEHKRSRPGPFRRKIRSRISITIWDMCHMMPA